MSVPFSIENVEQHTNRNDDLAQLRLFWRHRHFHDRLVLNYWYFLKNESQLNHALKIFSGKVSFMGYVVVEQKVVDILLGNRIVESERCKYFS